MKIFPSDLETAFDRAGLEAMIAFVLAELKRPSEEYFGHPVADVETTKRIAVCDRLPVAWVQKVQTGRETGPRH